MDVYKMYTNTGNHVARGSLLSDTVITLLQKHRQQSSFGWLISETNYAENWEIFLHIVAQETINLNVTLVYLNLMRIWILKVIFGWKRCALYLRKCGILIS